MKSGTAGIGRAYQNSDQLKFSVGEEYLLDSKNLIKKFGGDKQLIMNLKYEGQLFGIWVTKEGLYYVSRKNNPAASVHTCRNGQRPR